MPRKDSNDQSGNSDWTKSLVNKETAGDMAGGLAALLVDSVSSVPGVGAVPAPIVGKRATFLTGKREQKRVDDLVTLAAKKMQQLVDSGKHLRADWFSDGQVAGGAEETVEHALSVARKDPEAAKIPYLANMLAKFCFDASVNVSTAHQLLTISGELTYRQLCILNMSAILAFSMDSYPKALDAYKRLHLSSLRSGARREDIGQSHEEASIVTDCMNLNQRRLIRQEGTALIFLNDIVPQKLRFVGLGRWLWELMELSDIPDDDIRPLVEFLGPEKA